MSANNQYRSNAYAVIIGVNKYKINSGIPQIPPLNFACADAKAVYQVLTSLELGRVSPENVLLLLDEKATQRGIETAIATWLPSVVGENDTVFIFYAGHGAPLINPKTRTVDHYEKYLIPYDAEINNLRASAISMEDVKKFFGYIESRQVLFFIDSCYSGLAGGRTFPNPYYQTRTSKLDNEFLEDLTANEGRIVMTACDANETAIEDNSIKHGLFTYYLVKGLSGAADHNPIDGKITFHELYEYVHKNVSAHAQRLGGSMHPMHKGDIKGKIVLTQYKTDAQKEADKLHEDAQIAYDKGKFEESRKLWQVALTKAPDHENALHGLEAAMQRLREESQRLQEESRRAQEILDSKQTILMKFYNEEMLSAQEYDVATNILVKRPEELTSKERQIRRLLDDLIDGKITISSYLRSLNLIRNPWKPKDKTTSTPPKQELREKEKPKSKPKTSPTPSKAPFQVWRERPISKLISKEKLEMAGMIVLFISIVLIVYFSISYFEKEKIIASRLKAANDLFHQNSFNEALSILEQILREKPEHQSTLDLKSQIVMQRTVWSDTLMKTAEAFFDKKLYEDATPVLNQILAENPRYTRSSEMLEGIAQIFETQGGDYFKLKHYWSAIVNYRKAYDTSRNRKYAIQESLNQVMKARDDALTVTLRDTGIVVTREQLAEMLKQQDFYDWTYNDLGKGLEKQYELIKRGGDEVVADYVTGLTWQRSNSKESLTYQSAGNYIRELNDRKFAGHNDWRLPTLEEVYSLVRPRRRAPFYVDPVFDKVRVIWTADIDGDLGVERTRRVGTPAYSFFLQSGIWQAYDPPDPYVPKAWVRVVRTGTY